MMLSSKIQSLKSPIFVRLFVFLSVFSWVFLGWPQIGFDTPTTSFKFPPKIQEAYAAFPTVVGTNNSQTVTNSAPTIDLPAGIASGDLIIVFLAQDGAATATWPSPWVELVDENAGTAANLHVAYLIASGGETTVAPTMSFAERSQHLAIRISAASWHGTTPPEVAAAVAGTSAAPNSGSLTPSWGSVDTLWITTFGIDQPASSGNPVTFPVTGWPTNYTDNNLSNGESDNSTAGIALATRNLATATQDPGAFTTTGSDDWVASTIAVRPAAVPVVSSLTVTPRTDGSGVVDISVDVTDGDADNVKLKIGYGTATPGTSDPTLDQTASNVTATVTQNPLS